MEKNNPQTTIFKIIAWWRECVHERWEAAGYMIMMFVIGLLIGLHHG
jgi:hypothetical protein